VGFLILRSDYNKIEVLNAGGKRAREVQGDSLHREAVPQQETQLLDQDHLEAKYAPPHPDVNKVETEVVTHQDCQSLFQQPLELELNLLYNATEGRFEPKFVPPTARRPSSP
jgi:hypothetical protein